VTTELEIECLAEQLPEFLTVDLSNAVKGKSYHVEDLGLASHIKLVTHGRKAPILATVVEPVEEVIAAPVAAAEPAKGKKKK
jgi:large subunit ribosomal protein L25